jgi:hypothetical protein
VSPTVLSGATSGSLLPFVFVWRVERPRRARAALGVRLGGLRCAPTPLRCSGAWPRRQTCSVSCAHCASDMSPSQFTCALSRAAMRPALLGASHARRAQPGRTLANHRGVQRVRRAALRISKAAGERVAARIWGAEERRACGPRAQRDTSSDSATCPKRSERSSRSKFVAVGRETDAVRPDVEQSFRTVPRLAHALALASARARRGVGAKRRPLRLRAAACPPAALPLHPMHEQRTAATSRT